MMAQQPAGVFRSEHTPSLQHVRSALQTAVTSSIFAQKFTYRSGIENWDIAAGDMNNDGVMDLVTASRLDGKINVHTNDGIGILSYRQDYASDVANRALAVFDANGDNWQDVVSVTTNGRMCVLLNDKRGQLRRPLVTELDWTSAHDVTNGDLDADGDQDIVVAFSQEEYICAYFNDGKGNFTRGIPIQTASKARAVRVGDINDDGSQDLIVGCDDNRVYLYVNNQEKEFVLFNYLSAGTANWAIEVADLNNDRKLDIVAVGYEDKRVSIFFNKGYGEYVKSTRQLLAGAHTFSVAAGDFDGDKDMDLVSCSTTDQSIYYFRNKGSGIFESLGSVQSGNWNSSIVVADVDNDGALDVATSSINDNNINVHLNANTPADATEVERLAPPKLFGTVFDNVSKRAIGKATISLLDEQGNMVASTQSDQNGRYEFTPERGYNYFLQVQPAGMAPQRDKIFMPGYDARNDIFVRRQACAIFEGKVINLVSEKPVPGAIVEVKDEKGFTLATVTTDELGAFRQNLPLDGKFEATAMLPGHSVDRFSFTTNQVVGELISYDFRVTDVITATQTLVLGRVQERKEQQGVYQAEVMVVDPSGRTVTRVKTDVNGYYKLSLPYGRYRVSVAEPSFFSASSQVHLYKTDPPTVPRVNFEIARIEKESSVELSYLTFDLGSLTFRKECRPELDKLAEVMMEHPSLKIEIGGHTDDQGDPTHNLVISESRAKSVAIYLLSKGIDDDRVVPVGYGSSKPLVPNDTEENRIKNRRIELRVLAD